VDKFSRYTSVIALVIAVLAVIIPYVQSNKQFEAQQTERLNIVFNSKVHAPLVLTKHSFGERGWVVQMPWKITLSNVGNRPLSITDYDISQGKNLGNTYFTGIDGGLIEHDHAQVKLPIKLDVGESVSIYAYLGAVIPVQNYKHLSSISEGGSVSDRAATAILAKHGTDLFGNRVVYQEFEGGGYHVEFLEVDKSPTFWLTFHTGAGNRFVGRTSKYDMSGSAL